MKTIIWLIAHEPQHLFLRTAAAFSERVRALTHGEINIEAMTVAEYKEKYDSEFDEQGGLFGYLQKNKIQMSQTQVHRFSMWDLNYRVFDLPFLFRDHDHATKVLEGPIGQIMGERLGRISGMRGLAFTYSGGFRVVGSNEPITGINDLKNKRVRVNMNPVNADFMSSAGAIPNPMSNYGYDEIEEGTLDLAETTYIRFLGKHVLKTNHNMFLTTIVVNDAFWNELGEKYQAAFKQAALESARLERQWSIEDAEEFERNCVKNGVTIYSISDEDREYLRELSQQVYDKWEPQFLPGLIKEIQTLQ